MWKVSGYSKFAFKPTIMDLQKIKDYCNLNQNRLIVSACDIDYFERNIDSLVVIALWLRNTICSVCSV